MEKKNDELELLKTQNELLKMQLKSGNNNGVNKMLIVIIILLCAVIAGGLIFYFSKESDNDDKIYYPQQETTREKQCVKWENEYNFDYCKYAVGNDTGCKVTGQKCVEWK